MFVRFYFDDALVTDSQAIELGKYMQKLKEAGCEIGISSPPETYVLVRYKGEHPIIDTFPIRATKVLITAVIDQDWGRQPITRETTVERALSELLDMGLPIIKEGFPTLPQQGFYRTGTQTAEGVAYTTDISRMADGSPIFRRLVLRIEALNIASAIRLYADITSGKSRPMTPWDDTCDLEGRAILELPETANN